MITNYVNIQGVRPEGKRLYEYASWPLLIYQALYRRNQLRTVFFIGINQKDIPSWVRICLENTTRVNSVRLE